MSWHGVLIEYLIGAGTVGRSQSEIITRLSRQVEREEIIGFLEALKSVGKVQRFEIGHKAAGRPRNMWRATTKIRDGHV